MQKNSIRRVVPLWALGCLFAPAQAQEHPLVDVFTATEGTGSVMLSWTMSRGSTCLGLGVERAVNGGPFAEVHNIPGFCGAIDQAVTYEWVDADVPELSELAYRLDFGVQGKSSERRVHFDQLNSTDHRFVPNPTSGEGRLLLRTGLHERVVVTIWDAAGHAVFGPLDQADNVIVVPQGRLSSGVHTYRAETLSGSVMVGHFVVY
jgi:hypothetical protein